MANRTIFWAEVFVDELARAGLRAVCIAPGSRSTPLTLAFANHPAITVYSHLDERSAAFFALGLALAHDAPAALVCTSGSAAANFFPAVIEAHMSRVPLLVLTADRAHELRHSGANQTIDQIKLYGDYARWFVDVAPPEADPPAVALRNLRTLAARAYAVADGTPKGVVHLNFPFRKPLEPTPVPGDRTSAQASAAARGQGPFVHMRPARPAPPPEAAQADLRALVDAHERGVVVAGPGAGPEAARLAAAAGYPLLADVTSGARFGAALGAYETFMHAGFSPATDLIIRVGNVPTGKWINAWLETAQPAHYVHIAPDGLWADDAHRVSDFYPYDPAGFTVERVAGPWLAAWHEAEAAAQTAAESVLAETFFDGVIAADMVDLLPEGATLFSGNSLPVRLLDQFARPGAKRIHIHANRGASGIDGNISTALGMGAARPDAPLAALVGDITFYHDMNGLLAARRCGVPVTLVLLNNNGGGIFYRLPVRDYDPAFTDLFVTPHGLQFEHAARLYDLEYICADSRESFRAAFAEGIGERRWRIIEVPTDPHHDLAARDAVIAAARDRIRNL